MVESIDETRRQERLERSPSVIGHADRRGVRAGERITFFVSSEGNGDYDAQLMRLASPSIGPIGPPFKAYPIEAPINGRHRGTHQPILIGSCARIEGPIPLDRYAAFEVTAFPTLIEPAARTIALLRATNGTTVQLTLGATDGLVLSAELPGGPAATITARAPAERAWTRIHFEIDVERGLLGLTTQTLPATGFPPTPDTTQKVTFSPSNASLAGAELFLAAAPTHGRDRHDPTTCFNGKLERPRVWSTSSAGAPPVAEWDFSIGIPTDTIRDIGPHGIHGTLANMPTRGTRGSRWTGDVLTWMADPEGYAAIHFHDTDLADSGWSSSGVFDVPADLPSGCYALRIAPADDSTPEFYVPFFVRPAQGSATADVAFVVPTTTYAAYANMHLRVTAQFNEMAHGRLTVLDSTDFLLLRMPELGRSTYDVHRDGSPVVYSSMSRPVTNFRPTGRMYKLCLDLMIVDWFDAHGYHVDMVTEDDLDSDGIEAVAPYRVLVTGSHPEYTTRKQLDAYEEFLRRGGRLMYLGGNGFYSAAEVIPEHPDAVEVRRPGQDNLWRVNHAEAASSSSGLPTGMWRNIGRPENALTGVGFITQGFDACTYYTRSTNSTNSHVSWIFEGLDADEVIGDFGILQGGAAGYEIDRHEIAKGSPPHSVVIASSGGHSNLYDLMVPSILDTLPNPSRTQDPIRADMVFFETGHGGAVFSVGSIAWAGSLSHDNYQNSVSTVTRNVLDRFLDPTTFTPPEP